MNRLINKTDNRLRTLVVKPVLECNANCEFCSSRLQLHRQFRGDERLSFSQWCNIIDEACSLGLHSVYISGGEPTLYKNVTELISHCKTNGLKVTLNTNGMLLNATLVEKFADAGLDFCVISMYSHKSNQHDNMKGVPGIHSKAVKAVTEILANGISAKFLNVLTSENLFDLPEFIRWASLLGISEISLSYLEGGAKAYLPTVEDIDRFCSETGHQCVNVIEDVFSGNNGLRDRNIGVVKGLFRFPDVSRAEIARGLYQPKEYNGCGRSRTFALILANGDVHPCNAVEYFHEPVAGNLFQSKLQAIWESEVYHRVREKGAGWCRRCPMARHSSLVFKESEVAGPSYRDQVIRSFKRFGKLKKPFKDVGFKFASQSKRNEAQSSNRRSRQKILQNMELINFFA